ncbi:glycerol-3-phosphate dehydrogenase [Thermaurantiacus sp.]
MAAFPILDLLVIGGGVNGTGIARDAAGRGLKVALLESGDLGSGTSSASTKLVHGGLRYLQFGEFALVRKALVERDRLLRAAPHIAWPQAFLLPLMPGGRPRWMLRMGLFLYDHLAPRHEVEGTSLVDLRSHPAGGALKPSLQRAYRYWDGWVDDARLVALLARDAAVRGALILTREAAAALAFRDGSFAVTTVTGRQLFARRIVNAAGPWAERVARDLLGAADAPRLRLVQGAHLVTRRVNASDDALTLQRPEGRVLFILPWGPQLSLIGTTETPVTSPDAPAITAGEEAELLAGANAVLKTPLSPADIRHRFAGIRPLVLEEGKSDSETTRDWRFIHHQAFPATTVVGGKITTFRALAEALVSALYPGTSPWTASAVLPGGAIPPMGPTGARANFEAWCALLVRRFQDHDPRIVRRLANLYGSEAEGMLESGLGALTEDGLFEAEIAHLSAHEFARTRDDMLWRRTRMGLEQNGPAILARTIPHPV